MAIQCPKCGKNFDVTLFQYGHRVQCTCGYWVDMTEGHTREDGGTKGDAENSEP